MTLFQEPGFEIVPEAFDRAAMSSIVEALERADIHRSRAGIRNILRIDAIRSFASDDRLMNFAQAALGENAFPFRATLFDKSPRSNWLVVWHQDTALPLRDRRDVSGWGPWSVKEGVICAHAPASALEQVLAIRVHLDNSNAENGSLRVLPGTHTSGVLTDDVIHDLASRISAVNVYVAAGGVLLMSPLLVHASSKINPNAEPRRVLHIEYSSCRRFPPGIELAIC